MLFRPQVLVGSIKSEDWVRFESRVTGVEVFEVNAENEVKPSISAFVQVLSKLSGKPFLPTLKTVRVHHMGSFLNLAQFLLPPSIENVEVTIKPLDQGVTVTPSGDPSIPSPDDPGVLEAFLQVLITQAPSIIRLRIDYPAPLTKSSLGEINQLVNLRTLNISRLNGVQSTEGILASLRHIKRLEELRLAVEVASNYQLVPRPPLGPRPSSSAYEYLPSLLSLDIKGPSQLLTEFLELLGAPALVSLSLESTCWLHGVTRKSSETKKKKKGGSPSTSTAPVIKTDCSKECDSLHVCKLNLRSLWEKSLKRLTIISSPQTYYGLSPLASLAELRELDVRGGVSSLASLLVDSNVVVWNRLQSLRTSGPHSILTLDQLRDIAKRSPNLQRMSVGLHSPELSEESLNEPEPLTHSLVELIINDIEGTAGVDLNGNGPGAFSPRHASGVARALHLLFPNLSQLKCTFGQSVFWECVGEMMKLSRVALQDERRRQKTGSESPEVYIDWAAEQLKSD